MPIDTTCVQSIVNMDNFWPDLPVFDEPYLSYPTQSHSIPEQAYRLHDDSLVLEAPAPEALPIIRQLASTQRSIPHSFDPSSSPYPNQPHNAQSLSDPQCVSETTMRPPAKPRKRKAPTLRAKDWEPHKARIIELHIGQDLPLRQVKDTIKRESGFEAEYVFPKVRSERQPSTTILTADGVATICQNKCGSNTI